MRGRAAAGGLGRDARVLRSSRSVARVRQRAHDRTSSGQQPQGAVRSKASRPWRHSWSARQQISPASIGQRPAGDTPRIAGAPAGLRRAPGQRRAPRESSSLERTLLLHVPKQASRAPDQARLSVVRCERLRFDRRHVRSHAVGAARPDRDLVAPPRAWMGVREGVVAAFKWRCGKVAACGVCAGDARRSVRTRIVEEVAGGHRWRPFRPLGGIGETIGETE